MFACLFTMMSVDGEQGRTITKLGFTIFNIIKQ